MKRIEIRNIEELLKNVNLRKVEKDTANAVLALHIALFGKDKETTEMMEEARKTLLKDRDEEVKKLTELREEYKTADDARKAEIEETIKTECAPILETEKQMGEQFQAIMSEDVKVKYEKLEAAQLMEALNAAEVDYSVATLDSLSAIIKK